MNLADLNTVIRDVREIILADLPNDLTKLVYLASLRDYNTGHYFHPQISRQNDSPSVNHALRLCHEEVFVRLTTTPLSEYVAQLAGYISYSQADKTRVIDTWKSLQAYRATVPLAASELDADFFFASIEAALEILAVEKVEQEVTSQVVPSYDSVPATQAHSAETRFWLPARKAPMWETTIS